MADAINDAGGKALAEILEMYAPLETRIDHAVLLLPLCVGLDNRATGRGFNIACRLLGLRYDPGRLICCALRIKNADLARQHGGEPDPRVIGFVYECEPVALGGIYKIGFSQDPEKRIEALSLKYKTRLRLTKVEPGTMLSEHARQCQHRRDLIFGEWFQRPDNRTHVIGQIASAPPAFLSALGLKTDPKILSMLKGS